jgi:SAM-dependent methyltransferase
MKPQGDWDVYFKKDYDSKARFASYWHQIQETLDLAPKKVLEIGKGSGFVSRYLKEKGLDIVTVDIEERLKPGIRNDLLHLSCKDGSFDLVLCCELLEHLPYESFSKALSEIRRVSSRFAVISLPDAIRAYRLLLELPRLGVIQKIITAPRLIEQDHAFDGYHYWEIGKSGSSLKRVAKDLQGAGFNIRKTYRVFENPFHRFFVLEKREG